MYNLRDYQTTAVNSVRESLISGKRAPVMTLPTGAGKSIIFGEIIRLAVEKGKTVLWLVHRRNLVKQMAETLEGFGITPGIIMAGIESDTGARVQLGTIQTYTRRLDLQDLEWNRFFINADMVLIDEAHRSLSKTYKTVIDLYGEKIVIGCTATPMRADGRGMGEVYDTIVDVVGVKELTDDGHLSPARYFAPSEPDLEKIKVSMGDYQVKDLGKRMNKPQLVGDIVENWLRIAEGRQTIIFCVNVKHSLAVKEAFERAGITAYHLDARSPDDEREYAFKQMETGDINVLCNVALYQEGMDCPNISCVVMARPTKSMGLYRQCCGRGLRPADGKENCMIIDHGGVIYEHGLLDEMVYWTLDGKKKAWKTGSQKKESAPVICRVCKAVFEGTRICPDCGTPVKTYSKKIDVAEAELREINKAGKKDKSTMAEKRRFYGMLEYERRMRGYAQGWSAHKYRTKFGVWPNGLKGTAPIQTDAKFCNWIRYQNIKYHKRNAKHAA